MATSPPLPPRHLVFKGRYAILDEHKLPGTAKRPPVVVDVARLQTIADNCNQRIKETGDEIPLVLGHTDDDATEMNQPPIVGLAKNFALAPLFETGRQAIWSDFYFYDDMLEEARKYPRRSVELWASKNVIDPISLLSASTPERDLGLMKFQNQETPYRYSLPEEEKIIMPTDDKTATPDTQGDVKGPDDALVDQVIAKLMQTDVMKKLEELVMSMSEDKPQDDEQGEVPPPPSQEQPAPDGKEAAKYNEPAPVRFDASMASGTNTSVPSTGNKKDKYQMADEEKVKYSKLETRANVLETEVKALKALNEEMVLRYKKDSATLIFNTLVGEGYDVDETDKAMLVQFSIDNQSLHADKIRLKYKKAPVGDTGTLDEALKYSANGAPQGVQSQEDATKVAELALKDGISYSDAETKLYGKTK